LPGSRGGVAVRCRRCYAAGGVAAMLRIWALVLSGWIVVGAGFAQTFEEGIAKAQVEIDAKRWSAAFAGLLGLSEVAADDSERTQLAVRLHEVGDGLRKEAAFAAALRAHEAALAMFERVHGDHDHPNVAASLNGVGSCLFDLGQRERALPLLQQAHEMY